MSARCLLRFCTKHDVEASAIFHRKRGDMSVVFMDRVAKPAQEPDAAACAISYEPYAADDRARLREIVETVARVHPLPFPPTRTRKDFLPFSPTTHA